MIKFEPGHYYLAVWNARMTFAMGGLTGGDWMACVSRKENEPTTWRLQYRFRYYKDDKVFGSDDRRNWYEGTIKDASEEKVRETVDAIGEGMTAAGGFASWSRIDIKGDCERAVAALQATDNPMWHMGRIGKDALTPEEEAAADAGEGLPDRVNKVLEKIRREKEGES